jgi:hypothetical protein
MDDIMDTYSPGDFYDKNAFSRTQASSTGGLSTREPPASTQTPRVVAASAPSSRMPTQGASLPEREEPFMEEDVIEGFEASSVQTWGSPFGDDTDVGAAFGGSGMGIGDVNAGSGSMAGVHLPQPGVRGRRADANSGESDVPRHLMPARVYGSDTEKARHKAAMARAKARRAAMYPASSGSARGKDSAHTGGGSSGSGSGDGDRSASLATVDVSGYDDEDLGDHASDLSLDDADDADLLRRTKKRLMDAYAPQRDQWDTYHDGIGGDRGDRGDSSTAYALDLALYVLSGIALIFVMEQFIQVGTRMRYY